MPPTKKRKAKEPAATSPEKKSNGTAARKKQMTKHEKQEALDRAQTWAAQRKTAAAAPPSRATPSKKPAASKKKAIPSKKPAAAATTKEQKLQEARIKAAAWAAQELASPKRKTSRTTASIPPIPGTNSATKVSSTTKKTKATPKKKTPVKKVETENNSDEQKKAKQNETKGQEFDKEPAHGWGYKARILVAMGVLMVSLGMAVCTWCPASTALGMCGACDRFMSLLHLDEAIKSSIVEKLSERKSMNEAESEHIALEDWQKCRIFAAPSKIPGGGWGVFAAKDFEQHEMVEVAPMFVPIDKGTPVVKNSALDDYIYGYHREASGDAPAKEMAAVSLGNIMMYNHATSPNVKWMGFGHEPNREHQDNAKAVGFVATRAIKAGEELFSSYGLHDGGEEWFRSRRLERQQLSTEEAQLSSEELQMAMQSYCPKLYAGFGREVFKTRVLGNIAPENIPGNAADGLYPKQNAGFGKVIAKVPLKPGDVIESGPALAMHVDYIVGTALAPLVFGWNVLMASHRINLRLLREAGHLTILHQSVDTNWRRIDHWDGYDKLVILPAAGSIAMVERVGHKDETANCRLEISGSGSGEGSAGIILRLVATRNVDTGETLRLAVNPGGTSAEHIELRNEMQRTGQPL